MFWLDLERAATLTKVVYSCKVQTGPLSASTQGKSVDVLITTVLIDPPAPPRALSIQLLFLPFFFLLTLLIFLYIIHLTLNLNYSASRFTLARTDSSSSSFNPLVNFLLFIFYPFLLFTNSTFLYQFHLFLSLLTISGETPTLLNGRSSPAPVNLLSS